jgi:hypothetical protein
MVTARLSAHVGSSRSHRRGDGWRHAPTRSRRPRPLARTRGSTACGAVPCWRAHGPRDGGHREGRKPKTGLGIHHRARARFVLPCTRSARRHHRDRLARTERNLVNRLRSAQRVPDGVGVGIHHDRSLRRRCVRADSTDPLHMRHRRHPGTRRAAHRRTHPRPTNSRIPLRRSSPAEHGRASFATSPAGTADPRRTRQHRSDPRSPDAHRRGREPRARRYRMPPGPVAGACSLGDRRRWLLFALRCQGCVTGHRGHEDPRGGVTACR